MVGASVAVRKDFAAEEYAATLVVAASSQDKLLKVADRYRRPFAAMILEPIYATRESLSEPTLEMLFSLGESSAVLAYIERMIAGLESPFRVAAKSKASTLILKINADAANATRCDFGAPQKPAINSEWDKHIKSSMQKDAQELAKYIPWQGDIYETRQAFNAVNGYGKYGSDINKALRKGKKLWEVEHIDHYIANGPKLLKDTTLLRGINVPDKTLKTLKKGAVLSDPGFASTTTAKNLVEEFAMTGHKNVVVFEIAAKAGQATELVGSGSLLAKIRKADEWLLKRGQKMVVKNVRTAVVPHRISGNPVTVTYVEVILK